MVWEWWPIRGGVYPSPVHELTSVKPEPEIVLNDADVPPVQTGRPRKKRRKKSSLPPKPRFSDAQRLFVLNMWGRCCLACGSAEKMCIDHITPWKQTQEHHLDNWQPLCWLCNRAKNTRTVVDYRLTPSLKTESVDIIGLVKVAQNRIS